jgi:uncharacterized protein with von Willebrand factor type A (vWA) domain
LTFHVKHPERQTRVVRTDPFDDECFRSTTSESRAFARIAEAGETLYPHFRDLCHDLFAVLFKLDVRLEAPEELASTARVSRFVIETFTRSGGYAEAHQRTRLDEAAASRAMLWVAGVVVRMFRREELLTRDEMVRLHEVDRLADALADKEEELDSARELAKRADRERKPHLEDAADEIASEIEELREDAERAREEAEAMISGIPSAVEEALRGEADNLPERLDRQQQALSEFGRQMGVPGDAAVHEKLDLGEELVDNRKLQLLAKMVGIFREFALAERRRQPLRRAAEVHDVTRGADLGHLLPSELLTLRHPILGRLFRRSYHEHGLLQYDLRTEAEAGRGPAVLCLDVSSSMQGPREMWAKAIALTLLELARRQRRAFKVLCFSAGPSSVTEFDLLPAQRGATARNPVAQEDLVRLAAFFPGGGTDYQQPLSRALAIIEEAKKPRADIVFITDGESALQPQWLDHFLEQKKRLGFKVFTVLIDLQATETRAVAAFSDRITSVSKLTADAGRDLFLSF